MVRSDDTSSATHEMRRSRGRAPNDNYAALLDHYGLRSTRINRGQSHENGVAEQGHYHLKDAVDQALILRGSRDFHTADDYAGFVQQMVKKRNRLVMGKLEQEMACLRPLPPAPMPEYVNYQSKVRKWSTIQIAGHSYSVPSRLIGKEVQTLTTGCVTEVEGIMVARDQAAIMMEEGLGTEEAKAVATDSGGVVIWSNPDGSVHLLERACLRFDEGRDWAELLASRYDPVADAHLHVPD